MSVIRAEHFPLKWCQGPVRFFGGPHKLSVKGRPYMENLTSPRVIRDLLQRYRLDTKKSFGQNFLTDANTLRKIADAAGLSPDDWAVEVGAGLGTLTRLLAEQAGRVITFEADRDLLPVLNDTLGDYRNKIDIIGGDFLKADLRETLEGHPGPEHIKIVANLPYYITTPILFHLFDSGVSFNRAVLLVQREVARRIQAPPGGKEYGALSVAVQYRAVPEIVADVPPTVFYPPPKVHSSILRLNMRSEPPVRVPDESLFFRLVRAGFAYRRKTLLNALLAADLPISREGWQSILARSGIDIQARAETLNLAQFGELTRAVHEAIH